ncbi:unnamed protein product, partial [Effrenium voratum]
LHLLMPDQMRLGRAAAAAWRKLTPERQQEYQARALEEARDWSPAPDQDEDDADI